MAEDDKKEEQEGDDTEEQESSGESKKSRGTLKLLGGIAGLIATGTILAVMAMPKKSEARHLEGPAMHSFFGEGEIVGNPKDDNFSRYLKFSPSCLFVAYDLTYPEVRGMDVHYETVLRETMQYTISTFSIDEVMAGANRDAFSSALDLVAEPILFPVHIGLTASPYDLDEKSGLRVGDSQEREGGFRGYFYEHTLTVDADAKTIQFDEGTVQDFNGNEEDLLVENENEQRIYVNVTRIQDGFDGEVHVGVMGRIKRLFTGDIIAQ